MDTRTSSFDHSSDASKRMTVTLSSRWASSRSQSEEDLSVAAAKSGYLFKRGGGNRSFGWKRRWFVLSGLFLYYYKTDKDRKYKGMIGPLKEYAIESDVDDYTLKQFQFRIVPKGQTLTPRIFYIYAQSEDEKTNWINVLTNTTMGEVQHKKSVEIEEKLKSFFIPPTDLEWNFAEGTLGKGASGVVKKGKWLKNTDVAVKTINNLPEFTGQDEVEQFFIEIKTLSGLRHPNIVPMFGYTHKDGFICLVTEWVKGGDLSFALRDQGIPMRLGLRLELCLSICRGMVYLHSKSITHRDLKPGNILVENIAEAKVKVCDFGLSTIDQIGEERSITYGTPAYAAPELSSTTSTEKVDVFSFGVIMWEIWTREKPWSEMQHSALIGDAVQSGKRLAVGEDWLIGPLIRRCWSQDPKMRPSFPEIYEELERLRVVLSPSDRTSRLITEIPVEIEIRAEERIERAFGAPNSQSMIPWSQMVTVMMETFALTRDFIEKLKYVVASGEYVYLDRWHEFLKWFTPLVQPNLYQTSNSSAGYHTADDSEGYLIEDVIDIVGADFFFGFMSSAEARDILLRRPIGTFLFRFSSNPGCYALSVNFGQIGHWRITTEKFGTSYPIFRIDGRGYKSLHEVVEIHLMEPLTIKASNQTADCFLKEPVTRKTVTHTNNTYTDLYQ